MRYIETYEARRMTHSQESRVSSSQDTLLLREENRTSVTALVNGINACLNGADVSVSNDPLKVEKMAATSNQEGSKQQTAYPWLPSFEEACRSALGGKSIKKLENLIATFSGHVSEKIKECYTRPNRAAKLRKCINETLMFFHMFYQDVRKPGKRSSYLDLMTELVAMYIDMEIKAACRQKEKAKKITSRVTTALYLLLDKSEDHVLDAILKAKLINKQNKDVCLPMLGKIVNQVPLPLSEMSYVRYLLIFKLFKKVIHFTRKEKQQKSEEEKRINKLAVLKLKPPDNFVEKVKIFTNVLPKIPPKSKKNVTHFFMQAKFNLKSACTAFLKGVKEFQEGLYGSTDKELFCSKRLSVSPVNNDKLDGGAGSSNGFPSDIWASLDLESLVQSSQVKELISSKKDTSGKKVKEKVKKKKKNKNIVKDKKKDLEKIRKKKLKKSKILGVCGGDTISMLENKVLGLKKGKGDKKKKSIKSMKAELTSSESTDESLSLPETSTFVDSLFKDMEALRKMSNTSPSSVSGAIGVPTFSEDSQNVVSTGIVQKQDINDEEMHDVSEVAAETSASVLQNERPTTTVSTPMPAFSPVPAVCTAVPPTVLPSYTSPPPPPPPTAPAASLEQPTTTTPQGGPQLSYINMYQTELHTAVHLKRDTDSRSASPAAPGTNSSVSPHVSTCSSSVTSPCRTVLNSAGFPTGYPYCVPPPPLPSYPPLPPLPPPPPPPLPPPASSALHGQTSVPYLATPSSSPALHHPPLPRSPAPPLPPLPSAPAPSSSFSLPPMSVPPPNFSAFLSIPPPPTPPVHPIPHPSLLQVHNMSRPSHTPPLSLSRPQSRPAPTSPSHSLLSPGGRLSQTPPPSATMPSRTPPPSLAFLPPPIPPTFHHSHNPSLSNSSTPPPPPGASVSRPSATRSTSSISLAVTASAPLSASPSHTPPPLPVSIPPRVPTPGTRLVSHTVPTPPPVSISHTSNNPASSTLSSRHMREPSPNSITVSHTHETPHSPSREASTPPLLVRSVLPSSSVTAQSSYTVSTAPTSHISGIQPPSRNTGTPLSSRATVTPPPPRVTATPPPPPSRVTATPPPMRVTAAPPPPPPPSRVTATPPPPSRITTTPPLPSRVTTPPPPLSRVTATTTPPPPPPLRVTTTPPPPSPSCTILSPSPSRTVLSPPPRISAIPSKCTVSPRHTTTTPVLRTVTSPPPSRSASPPPVSCTITQSPLSPEGTPPLSQSPSPSFSSDLTPIVSSDSPSSPAPPDTSILTTTHSLPVSVSVFSEASKESVLSPAESQSSLTHAVSSFAPSPDSECADAEVSVTVTVATPLCAPSPVPPPISSPTLVLAPPSYLEQPTTTTQAVDSPSKITLVPSALLTLHTRKLKDLCESPPADLVSASSIPCFSSPVVGAGGVDVGAEVEVREETEAEVADTLTSQVEELTVKQEVGESVCEEMTCDSAGENLLTATSEVCSKKSAMIAPEMCIKEEISYPEEFTPMDTVIAPMAQTRDTVIASGSCDSIRPSSSGSEKKCSITSQFCKPEVQGNEAIASCSNNREKVCMDRVSPRPDRDVLVSDIRRSISKDSEAAPYCDSSIQGLPLSDEGCSPVNNSSDIEDSEMLDPFTATQGTVQSSGVFSTTNDEVVYEMIDGGVLFGFHNGLGLMLEPESPAIEVFNSSDRKSYLDLMSHLGGTTLDYSQYGCERQDMVVHMDQDGILHNSEIGIGSEENVGHEPMSTDENDDDDSDRRFDGVASLGFTVILDDCKDASPSSSVENDSVSLGSVAFPHSTSAKKGGVNTTRIYTSNMLQTSSCESREDSSAKESPSKVPDCGPAHKSDGQQVQETPKAAQRGMLLDTTGSRGKMVRPYIDPVYRGVSLQAPTAPTSIPYPTISNPVAIGKGAPPSENTYYRCSCADCYAQYILVLSGYGSMPPGGPPLPLSFRQPHIESDTDKLKSAEKLKSEDEELLRRIEESLSSNKLDAILDSKYKPELDSSLPPKKRLKTITAVSNIKSESPDKWESPKEDSFPSYPTRPMISIAELEMNRIFSNVQKPIKTVMSNNPQRYLPYATKEEAKKKLNISQYRPCGPEYPHPVNIPMQKTGKDVPVYQCCNTNVSQVVNHACEKAMKYHPPTSSEYTNKAKIMSSTSDNIPSGIPSIKVEIPLGNQNTSVNTWEYSGRQFKTPAQLKEIPAIHYYVEMPVLKRDGNRGDSNVMPNTEVYVPKMNSVDDVKYGYSQFGKPHALDLSIEESQNLRVQKSRRRKSNVSGENSARARTSKRSSRNQNFNQNTDPSDPYFPAEKRMHRKHVSR